MHVAVAEERQTVNCDRHDRRERESLVSDTEIRLAEPPEQPSAHQEPEQTARLAITSAAVPAARL